MAKHIVKCPKCNKNFDTNTEQAVKISARRYGHATCYPDCTDFVPLIKNLEDEDLTKLKAYITKIFGDNANWAMINKQIKKYKEEYNYSYSGILKSLIYFYEIQKNSIEKANNAIGIVPYCYQNAYNYYKSIFLAQQNSDTILKNRIKEFKITIPIKKGTKKRFFKLEDND